jgi:D-alanyl-D-alanine carboxypeptidase/D-alanyl-D-alanine-endopeptidase (penicillin-binding protein 4)
MIKSRRGGVDHLARGVAALVVLGALLAAWAGLGHASTPGPRAGGSPVGSVPAAAQTIMAKPAYSSARWLYYVEDQQSGKVLLANRPGEEVFTGSTAKLFTVGTGYDALGFDSRVTTPVYATAPVTNGVLNGNLVFVASGDLALGGRGALADKFDFTFNAKNVDHVYGDVAPNAAKPTDDPLAGLNSLARQVAAKGVTHINGDVVIDDRFWQTFKGQEGPVPPIFVNDNLLDITVTPAATGQMASTIASPPTSAYSVVSTVKTEAGSGAAIEVGGDPTDPHRILVTGTIGSEAGPRLTVYRVPDAASWARTLFVEALARAGVVVTAAPVAANQTGGLPAKGSYSAAQQLASLKSPPLRAIGTMILATSYNTGANALMCLLAAHAGSTNCLEGLKPMRALIDKAGLVSNDIALVDGQGADPASVTPQQMAGWVKWTQTQPWGATFKAGLPVLGEFGSLSGNGVNSPAKGKVLAKTGTSVFVDPATGRAFFNVESLAGFLKGAHGHTLVFDLSMSGGTFPDLLTGLVQSQADVAAVAAAFQEAVSR